MEHKKARRKCRRKMYDATEDLKKAAERLDAAAVFLGRDIELGRFVRSSAVEVRVLLKKFEHMSKKLQQEDLAARENNLTPISATE